MSAIIRRSYSNKSNRSNKENIHIDHPSGQSLPRNEICDDSLSQDFLLSSSFLSNGSLEETIALSEDHSIFASDTKDSFVEETILNRSFEIIDDENDSCNSNENSLIDKIDQADKYSDQRSPNRYSSSRRTSVLESLENGILETESTLSEELNNEILHRFKSNDALREKYLEIQDQSFDLFDRPTQKCSSMHTIPNVGVADVLIRSSISSQHLHKKFMNSSPTLSSRNVTGGMSSILPMKPSKSSPSLTNSKSSSRRRRSSHRGTLDEWILKRRANESTMTSREDHKPRLLTMEEAIRLGLVPSSSNASVDKSRYQVNLEPADVHLQSEASLKSTEFLSGGHALSPNRAHSEILFKRPLCTSSPLNKELLATPPLKGLSKSAATAHHILSPLNRLSPNLSSPLPDTPPPSASKRMLPLCAKDDGSPPKVVSKKLFPLFSRQKEGLQNDSKLTQHSREVAKIFSSPNFVQRYDEVKSTNKEHLQPGMVIRKKVDRILLHGFDCKCCVGYYDALGLSTQQKCDRVNEVSRHRGIMAEPNTPEHYWEVRMADREEQMRRGQIAESESPIALKTRYAHYHADVNIKRQLFR